MERHAFIVGVNPVMLIGSVLRYLILTCAFLHAPRVMAGRSCWISPAEKQWEEEVSQLTCI